MEQNSFSPSRKRRDTLCSGRERESLLARSVPLECPQGVEKKKTLSHRVKVQIVADRHRHDAGVDATFDKIARQLLGVPSRPAAHVKPPFDMKIGGKTSVPALPMVGMHARHIGAHEALIL
jgi:hypothetical protein